MSTTDGGLEHGRSGRPATGLSADGRALVLATVHAHAASLLRLARRHSLCADDAQDAYQRALEIFLRRADTLEPDGMAAWLRTVVKHEAMAVRAARQRTLAPTEIDFDAREAPDLPTADERLERFELVTRSAEALRRLKPQEARALLLKAEGHSYAEICDLTGWTYTKVNRCLTEGRKRFLERFADIQTGRECERWAPVLSAMVDGEATPQQLIELRPHLRNCAGCRSTLREFHRTASRIAAVVPPVGGLALGADGTPNLPHLLGRLLDAVTGGAHERALLAAHRWQVTLEAVSAGKVAAVAASTVALAGGVAAVEHTAERPAPSHHAAASRPASAPAASRAGSRTLWPAASGAMSGAAPRQLAAAKSARPARRVSVTRRRPRTTSAAADAPGGEFTLGGDSGPTADRANASTAQDASADVTPTTSVAEQAPARTRSATRNPRRSEASGGGGGEFVLGAGS